jgi:lipid A 3-O-deacylase
MRATARLPIHAFAAIALIGAAFAAGSAAAASAPDDTDSIWTIRSENDSISSLPHGSDQNYTAGNMIGWTSGTDVAPYFARSLAQALWGDGTVRVGLGLVQQLYTPSNLTLSVPDPRDRPYAGYLAGTASLMHDGDNVRDLLAFSLGVIGPLALGQEAQDFVHALVRDRLAQGWAHQLPNEPAVELLDQRTWRIPIAQVGGLETDMLPAVAVGVGTVRDYVQTALVVRIGHGLNTDFGTSRIRPGINGGDAFSDSNDVAWYVFGGLNGQGVARDAFLDGDLFSKSAHVQRDPWLGEMEVGFAVIWRGIRFSYVQTWQTEQFRHQTAGLFNFGSVALSMRF